MVSKTYSPVRSVEIAGTGVKVQIEIHRMEGELSATYGGTRYHGGQRTLAEFISYITQLVRQSLDVKWLDVISVRLPNEYNMSKFTVGFTASREHVAYIRGSWKYLEWGYDTTPANFSHLTDWAHFAGRYFEKDKVEVTPDNLTLPYVVHEQHSYRVPDLADARKIVLAYSPELWSGLEALQVKISELRSQLLALLTTEDSLKMIERVGTQAQALALLPPPTETETETTGASA